METKFEYVSWKPPVADDEEGLIDNVRMVKINQLRTELYDATEMRTAMDTFFQIVLPMALIILAIACMIFFPKINDSINAHGQAALEAGKVSWQDLVQKIKPVG